MNTMTDLTIRELAVRNAALKALQDRVIKHRDDVRAQLREHMIAEYDRAGTKTLDVGLGTEQPVATVTLPMNSARPYVRDKAAKISWMLAHHPEHVEQVVAEAFDRLLMGRQLAVADTDTVIHANTGEVIDWAGVVPSSPGVPTLSFKTGGREMAVSHLRDGALSGVVTEMLAWPE